MLPRRVRRGGAFGPSGYHPPHRPRLNRTRAAAMHKRRAQRARPQWRGSNQRCASALRSHPGRAAQGQGLRPSSRPIDAATPRKPSTMPLIAEAPRGACGQLPPRRSRRGRPAAASLAGRWGRPPLLGAFLLRGRKPRTVEHHAIGRASGRRCRLPSAAPAGRCPDRGTAGARRSRRPQGSRQRRARRRSLGRYQRGLGSSAVNPMNANSAPIGS